MRWALVILCWLALPLAAAAQEAENPVTRILVLGDALGGGLGAGLGRVAEAAGPL